MSATEMRDVRAAQPEGGPMRIAVIQRVVPETSESAPWAPAEGDAAAVGRWEQELEERLRRFGGRV